MATRTSSQNGNLSSSSTWGGSAAPGIGDDAIVNHIVTVDTNTTIGASGVAGTAAITVNGPASKSAGAKAGELIVPVGVTLTCRGDLVVSDGTLSNDGIIEFDPSASGSPTTTSYQLLLTDWFAQVNTRIRTVNTTSGNRFEIRTKAGSYAAARISSTGFDQCAKWTLAHGSLTRLGDTTHDAAQIYYGTRTNDVSIDDVVLDTCGKFAWKEAATAGSNISITNCFFTNTNASNSSLTSQPVPLAIVVANAAFTGTTRLVNLCAFDKPPDIPAGAFTYSNNVFADGYGYSAPGNSSGVPWTAFTNNFVRIRAWAATNLKLGGPASNNFVLCDTRSSSPVVTGTVSSAANPNGSTGTLTVSGTPWSAAAYQSDGSTAYYVVITSGTGVGQVRNIVTNSTSALTCMYNWDTLPVAGSTFSIYSETANPHLLSADSTSGAVAGFTLDGNIIQQAGADNNGDCFQHMEAPSATYTFLHNIVLPSASRDNTGTLLTLLGTKTTQSYDLRHNTYFTGAQCLAVAEGGNQAAGQVTVLKNNIAWADPSRTNVYSTTGGNNTNSSQLGPYKINDTDHSTSVGSGTANIVSAANADYNCGYGLKAGFGLKGYNVNTSGAGAHDVDTDPGFVDRWNASFWAWAVSRGSSGLHPVSQTTDGLSYLSANPSLVASSLTPFIQAQLAPTNAALQNAGSDGVTIGAVEYLAPASTGSIGIGDLFGNIFGNVFGDLEPPITGY